VDVPILGNTTPASAPTSSFKLAVGDTSNAVLGSGDFGTITVVEDDAVTGGTLASPVTPPADPCVGH
jgi:hypothetical protein